jgi:hypothetical protein
LLRAFLAVVVLAALAVKGQTNADSADVATMQAEREGCIKNLKLIYDAIQAYQMDHKDIPNWLSDLVPQYLSDANVLLCPVCRRTGETEASALADPKLPCSYLYEFCPLPLDQKFLAGNATRRDWKRRQMGLVGSMVPIVRCRHHTPLLNLAYDGRIYDSPGSWEVLMSNRVDVTQLSAARIFPPETKPPNATAKKPGPKFKYPRRDAKATTNEINLVKYYNAMLTQSWHGGTNNNLASLSAGLQKLAGVEFDVRGIVQLGSKSPLLKGFPTQVKDIMIHQKCQRLNFLHAVVMGTAADEGKTVGSYIVHFATNRMRADIPINYGQDVRDWHVLPKEKPGTELTIAWRGTNAGTPEIRDIRLFKTTWTNIAPDVEIDSIDYVSAMGTAAPFLVAITTE